MTVKVIHTNGEINIHKDVVKIKSPKSNKFASLVKEGNNFKKGKDKYVVLQNIKSIEVTIEKEDTHEDLR